MCLVVFYIYLSPFLSFLSDFRLYLIGNTTTIVTVIISEDIQNPEGIAVDPLHDHVYWTDSGTDEIVRANLDGTNRATIINSDLDKPRAIELDPSNEYVFSHVCK